MTQGDNSQEQVQAMRSVDINLAPNAVPTATPDEIYHIDTQLDPDTQREVVLWDDILQAFRNVVQVRNKSRVVPFLKGKDLRILEPRRIAAVPNTVLDVVVDSPSIDKEVASLLAQQLALQPISPHNDDSTMEVETASQSTTLTTTDRSSSGITSTLNAPSTATSTVPRNPVYGLVEAAMENYSHIDRPLAFPSARGPHAALDDQICTVKDLSTPSHPNSDNETKEHDAQSATTNSSVEIQLAQAIISASHGDKDAQVALGDMYRDGQGVAQDYQIAMDWYLKAVKQGDAAGQERLGGLYDKGFGVQQNYSTAMEWYLKAAKQGHAGSQYNLGELYFFGRGVHEDNALAMYWTLKAANQGHASALHRIGFMYDEGHGVPQDYTQAINWYLKAAQQGHASSQNNIGFLNQEGRGVPQDFMKAMDWYLKAANQGEAYAQSNIGYLYQHGYGVLQDHKKAAEWYHKAVDQGSAIAERALKSLSE